MERTYEKCLLHFSNEGLLCFHAILIPHTFFPWWFYGALGSMFAFSTSSFLWSNLSTFFFPFLRFSWSMVGLQGCDHCCRKTEWFRHTCAHIRSLWDYFPASIVTEYWVEFPVLYSRSPVARHSMDLNVQMPLPNPQAILLCPWLLR